MSFYWGNRNTGRLMVSFEVTAQSVTGSGAESRSFVENWIFDEKLHALSKIRKFSPCLSQEHLPREVGTWRQREEVSELPSVSVWTHSGFEFSGLLRKLVFSSQGRVPGQEVPHRNFVKDVLH